MILGNGIPKPDGTLDYFGANDPIRRPRQRLQGYTFSVRVFKWKNGKQGETIQTIKGSCDAPEYVYKAAERVIRNPYPKEWEEQKKIIQWKFENISRFPELKYLTASLNGFIQGDTTVAFAKSQGMVVGEPDLRLQCARRGFHSIVIELKRLANGRVSTEQKEYIAWLNKEGNCAKVCKGHLEAIKLLEWYLG